MKRATQIGTMRATSGASAPQRTPARGFTLIELLVFIIIISVAAVGLLIAVRSVMSRGLTGANATQAAEVAQMRMELILGQRDKDTYQSLSDPCGAGAPVAALCANPLGFNVSVTGVAAAVAGPCGAATNCRLITVTVRNSANTATLATLAGLLGNY